MTSDRFLTKATRAAAALLLLTAQAVAPSAAWAKGMSGGYSRPSVSFSAPSARTPSVFSRPSAPSVPSSGGYARPSTTPTTSGGYARPSAPTPSASPAPSVSSGTSGGSGGYARPDSAPATSGGYARPTERTPSAAPALAPSKSAGDLAISRQNSANALKDMEDRNRRSREAASPSPSPWSGGSRTPSATASAPPSSSGSSGSSGGGTTYVNNNYYGNGGYYGGGGGYYNGGGGWFGNRTPSASQGYGWPGDPSWQAPPYARRSTAAGVWNGLMLWFLLDTLTRPGHAEWFRQHRSDPGYQEWRRQADREAASNPELKGKLDDLDSKLGEPLSGPRDANYVPPDITMAQAKAPAPAPAQASGQHSSGGGFGGFLMALLMLALLAGALYLAFRWLKARNAARPQSLTAGVARTAEAVARSKLGKEDPAPPRETFRIGHVVPLDPSAFIIAGDAIRTPAPPPGSSTVTAIGKLEGLPLVRLYLNGTDTFLQCHVSDEGAPDEVRYFAPLDTVVPADADEWEFWLPKDGDEHDPVGQWMIGAPVFQTQDGVQWQRVWSPGERNVAPQESTEAVKDVNGTKSSRQSAMLYAKATGVETPDREYLLIVAKRSSSEASVNLYSGIDIEPATLNLSR